MNIKVSCAIWKIKGVKKLSYFIIIFSYDESGIVFYKKMKKELIIQEMFLIDRAD